MAEPRKFDEESPTPDVHRPPTRARLVGLFGPAAGQVFFLKGSREVMGRGVGANIFIDSLEISRRHALVWRDVKDRWYIKDMGSSNGCYINGQRITGTREILFGDRLQLARDNLFVFTHHDTLEDQVLQLQKMDALGQLAGEVAHDFKNLLTVFSATVDMWRIRRTRGQIEAKPPFSDKKMDHDIGRMDEACARANDLIQRLLAYARPSEGDMAPVDVSQVTRDAIRLCSETFPEGTEIKFEINADHWVPAHSTQIHQAVMNLLVNARDAMPHGGTIRVIVNDLRQSGVEGLDSPFSPHGFVCISVADNGQGMDQATKERIFDPFFTTKGEGKGTGLGLATVNAIAARHDGQVLVESEQGEGATFRLILPTFRVEPDPDTRTVDVTAEIPIFDFKATDVISKSDMRMATSAARWEEDLTLRSPGEDPEEK